MSKYLALCGLLLLLMPAWAQDAKTDGPVEAQLQEHQKNAMANPQDDPALPRVLLIGDSISIGYTVPVRKVLQGVANVHRPPVNCQHTGYGLQNIKKWLGAGKWDVIHFNWGIWDTHYLDVKSGALIRDESKLPPEQMRIRHTPEQYRANLTQLVETLKGTGATLIWASTTPVMYRKDARFEDIAKLNEVAAAVMKENGIAVEDLYTLTLANIAKWQSGDKVHFNAVGNAALGEIVGKSIQDALQARAQVK